MKYNLSEIMKTAWIYRKDNNYNMSQSLKLAWSNAKRGEIKMTKEQKIEKLEGVGNRWTKYDKDRIYLGESFLRDLLGLSVRFYKTGNVSCASLNGEKISNRKATGLLQTIKLAKIHYDVKTDNFNYNGSDTDSIDLIIEALNKYVA